MPAFEKLAVDAWIVARLEADTEISSRVSGVYSDVIPSNRTLPAIRFHLQTAHDVLGIGTHRLTARLRYSILAVCKGNSPGPLVPIVDKMDELLHGATGESATVEVMSVVRTEVISYSTVEEAVHYWHVGGMYEFQVNQK